MTLHCVTEGDRKALPEAIQRFQYFQVESHLMSGESLSGFRWDVELAKAVDAFIVDPGK